MNAPPHKPLTLTELKLSIKQLKLGKSPGPDGFTATYYKTFLEDPFLCAFNSLSPTTPSGHDLLEAHIAVVPKLGKDPTLVVNYRLISLLNIDLKIFTKILAIRIHPFLHSLITKDQVGFIPGGESQDNTTKAINLHHLLAISKRQGFFLSLDAEKSFDRLAGSGSVQNWHSRPSTSVHHVSLQQSLSTSASQWPSVKRLPYLP